MLIRSGWLELRHVVRFVRRNRGFVAVVSILLSIGLGLTVTLFSAMKDLLWARLPFVDREQMVVVSERNPSQGLDPGGVAPGNFLDLRASARSFSSLGFFMSTGRSTTINGSTPLLLYGNAEEEVRIAEVSPGLWEMLDTTPVIGRGLEDHEFVFPPQVAVIGHALWSGTFASDPGIVGEPIQIDQSGRRSFHTVVGVMPSGFDFPYPLHDEPADVWIPRERTGLTTRQGRAYSVVGRIAPGVTLEAARLELDEIARRLAQEYPESNRGWSFAIDPLQGAVFESSGRALFFLSGASVLVLVIAFANVAVLGVIRSLRRRRETFIRIAIGATRRDIFRDFALEGLAIAILSGVGAVFLSVCGFAILNRLASAAGTPPFALDPWVLGLVLIAGVAGGVAASILPARNAMGMTRPGSAWKSQARLTRIDSIRGLIVVQLVISTGLLLGAGVLITSYVETVHVDRGHRTEGIVVARVRPTILSFPTPTTNDPIDPIVVNEIANQVYERRRTFYSSLIARMESIPGVTSVAAVDFLDTGQETPFHFEPRRSEAVDGLTNFYRISPGYFTTIGATLSLGREFTATDRGSPDAPAGVVIVNETFVRQYWPNEDPIGNRLTPSAFPSRGPVTVVGVVRDFAKFNRPSRPTPEIYLPSFEYTWESMQVVAHMTGPYGAFLDELRREVQARDPDATISGVTTFEQIEDQAFFRSRLLMMLTSGFSLFALLITSMGIYSTFAYDSIARRKEIAVRMALGATRPRVVGWFLMGAGRLLGAGVGAGIVLSLILTRMFQGFMFGTVELPAATIAAVAVVVSLVVLGAAGIPAQHAASIEVSAVLKPE